MHLGGPPARACGEPHQPKHQPQDELIRLLRGEVPRIERGGEGPREFHSIAPHTEPHPATRAQERTTAHGGLQRGAESRRAADQAQRARWLDGSPLSNG